MITENIANRSAVQDVALFKTEIKKADQSDISSISNWFIEDSSKFNYSHQSKWKEWWTSKLEKSSEIEIYKLCFANSNTPIGIIALRPIRDLLNLGRRTLYICGIRVSPNFCYENKEVREIKGIGTKLVKFAANLALQKKYEALGLTSSLGIEPFYKKFQFTEQESISDERKYFSLIGVKLNLLAESL